MLAEFERRLAAAGVRRIQCPLAGESDIGALAVEHAGYTARHRLVWYERLEPVDPGSAGVLGQPAGRMMRAEAWDQLGGMMREKELIERRVILPLAQSALPERPGLVPPQPIVLFGPPHASPAKGTEGETGAGPWPKGTTGERQRKGYQQKAGEGEEPGGQTGKPE
jgi:transitional endoplasmic reticulum ATPase